jgi:hypothetical protein
MNALQPNLKSSLSIPLFIVQCRFKHTRQTGPPPDPETLEAAKPREFRNIAVVANQANEGILPPELRRKPLKLSQGEQFMSLPPSQYDGMMQGGGEMVVGTQASQGMPPSQSQLSGGGGAMQPPAFVDQALLAAVGQRDLRYGF